MSARPPHYWINAHLEAPDAPALGYGRLAAYSYGYEAHENQDAMVVFEPSAESVVLAVADGAGGMPLGGPAAHRAVDRLEQAVTRRLDSGASLRELILCGFDDANAAIQELGAGAAATLAVVTVEAGVLRTYHAGDAAVLVTGQRARVKLLTISHSPVGYAVEAGVITEEDAIVHEDRHVVSNLLGSADMRIEVGAELRLSARDTVVVGSDGLFDNLRIEEIAEIVRIKPPAVAATRLAQRARARMARSDTQQPSKPDDVSFLLYRLG